MTDHLEGAAAGPPAPGSLESIDASVVEAVPGSTSDTPQLLEAAYPDWRRRLTRNLARRSDGRWDPLTYLTPARAAPE